MPTPDKTKNYAYLSVKSETLVPEAVTTLTGITPDEVSHIGDISSTSGRPLTFHSWVHHISVADGEHLGTERLSMALEELGPQAAGRFRRVTDAGGTLVCQFVQTVRDDNDSWAKGIHLTPNALQWLAEAHAEFDIDQYFFTENPATDGYGGRSSVR